LQAIERLPFSNDWMTLVLLLLLVVLFLINVMNAVKFKEIIFSVFKVRFIESQNDENSSLLSGFQMFFFMFSVIVFSLLFFYIKIIYFGTQPTDIQEFLKVCSLLFFYFVLKNIFENILSFLFLFKRKTARFLSSKANYFFAISVYSYCLILLKQYANLNQSLLNFSALFLFTVCFIFYILNNKNLILNHLFYFILYICAFEIAPLLIVIKLMF